MGSQKREKSGVIKPTFIDVCAGCGGLSLGLLSAGWRGLFAIEKDGFAFSSLSHNLLTDGEARFDWPTWLPKEASSIEEVLGNHTNALRDLRGDVDLLAGGPPCQGFSTFGRRRAHDPRNQVFRHYIKLVELVQPRLVLMENVRGILSTFDSDNPDDNKKKAAAYAEVIKDELKGDYRVWSTIVYAKDFGVPQIRPRFILVGARKGTDGISTIDPFATLTTIRKEFLAAKGLDSGPVTVGQAISDLCRDRKRLEPCGESPGFKQGAYGKQVGNYQRLLHGTLNGAVADSHRFANHRSSTLKKFRWLQSNCDRGKKLDQDERGKYANKKHTLYILHPDRPAPTVTTLPDDMLHYHEPRILTVREMARLQSFPDWFEFKGKYTTGGEKRTKECPRYTQVGNAVPPLLAEALGRALLEVLQTVQR